MWSANKDCWALVGVANSNSKAVTKDVQLRVEVGAMHEEGMVEGSHSTVLKFEEGNCGAIHSVICLHLRM